MKKLLLPFVTLVFCFFAQQVSAQKLYLQADRLTENAGPTGTYRNYAVILSRQLGATAEVGVGGVSPANFQNLVITKNSDVFSNKLWNQMAKSLTIRELEIVSTTTAPNAPTTINVINKIELRDVVVTSIASSAVQGCDGGCNPIAESYKLAYKSIKITTYTQNLNTGRWIADSQPFIYIADGGSGF